MSLGVWEFGTGGQGWGVLHRSRTGVGTLQRQDHRRVGGDGLTLGWSLPPPAAQASIGPRPKSCR